MTAFAGSGRLCRTFVAAAALMLATGLPARLEAQEEPEPVTVSGEHPRLFLRASRLRLLRRERERSSARWRQLDALVSGNAPMPERGFALALHYQVSGDAAIGRQAVAWALGPGSDLRQLAIVFDWCQPILTDEQRRDLAARIQLAMKNTLADGRVPAISARALAAVALFDHVEDLPRRELERTVREWWNGHVVPALDSPSSPLARDDAYPLMELLHALRDTTGIDLREASPRYFLSLPAERLLGYYPAVYQGPENEFRVGIAAPPPAEPDLRQAALSRAADLAMVAFDTNSSENQFLQGWLMHDRFQMRGPFGAPYEFLWANPYQPGLSYYHMPLVFHDPAFGKLFARSSWDDGSTWFGYSQGSAQLFDQGRVAQLDPQKTPLVALSSAVVLLGQRRHEFHVTLEGDEALPAFIVGLRALRPYFVEIDDEEMYESQADGGGILEIELPHGTTGVRIREAPGQ